jgi:hypothetical protein
MFPNSYKGKEAVNGMQWIWIVMMNALSTELAYKWCAYLVIEPIKLDNRLILYIYLS